MKIKAALAAGALVVAAGAVGVVTSSTAQAEMAGWERIEASTTFSNGTGSYEAYCTSGKKVVGGGYDTDQSKFVSLNTRVVTNKPTGSGSGWTVSFVSDSGSGDRSLGVTIVAVCATP